MPITLIQLISEQTMQNLLPILRLRPARLIHLATPRTAARSDWIAEALRQTNGPVDMETQSLSRIPDIQEAMKATQDAIQRATQQGHIPLVNFTGGTKLMSIGAYAAASSLQAPSFYVDTQDSVFLDGQTGSSINNFFGNDLSFLPLIRFITLDAVVAANGGGRVTKSRDIDPWLPLAEFFFNHPEEEEACCQAVHKFSQISRPKDWLAALDQDLLVPEPVLDLAIQTGFFRPGSSASSLRLAANHREELKELARLDGTRHIPNFTDRLFGIVDPLQRALSILNGGWWEIIIANSMRGSERFRDVRWSALVGEQGGPEYEEDILALDQVRVTYVSCKRSTQGARLLGHLEEIKTRSERVGGTFNLRYLCIYRSPKPKVLMNLEKRAKELSIKVLLGEQFRGGNPFSA